MYRFLILFRCSGKPLDYFCVSRGWKATCKDQKLPCIMYFLNFALFFGWSKLFFHSISSQHVTFLGSLFENSNISVRKKHFPKCWNYSFEPAIAFGVWSFYPHHVCFLTWLGGAPYKRTLNKDTKHYNQLSFSDQSIIEATQHTLTYRLYSSKLDRYLLN